MGCLNQQLLRLTLCDPESTLLRLKVRTSNRGGDLPHGSMSQPLNRVAPNDLNLIENRPVCVRVDRMKLAAHGLIEAARAHIDVLRLDTQLCASSRLAPLNGFAEQRSPDA